MRREAFLTAFYDALANEKVIAAETDLDDSRAARRVGAALHKRGHKYTPYPAELAQWMREFQQI